jgi:hypothetical protein
MNHIRQRGFSAIEVIIFIVVIGVLIGGGVLLMQRSKPDSAEVPQNSGTQNSSTPSAKDYATYTSADLGFSFSYPKDWGTIAASAAAVPATGTTPELRNSTKYPFYFGALNFSVSAKTNFQFTGQKYGATYTPVLKNSYNNYIWKVVAVNPADTTDRIGDTYDAPITTSTTGVQLYNFDWSDESHTTKRWVFETKAGFVQLSLPYFGYSDKQPSSADTATHQAIADAISKSVQLIY